MASAIPLTHDDIDRRFTYHPPAGEAMVTQHEKVRAEYVALAHLLVDELPDGLEKVAALHKLQEAMFWSNAAIACDL